MPREMTDAELEAEFLAIDQSKRGALTEREKRVAPIEHSLLDPLTGETVTTSLTEQTAAQIEAGQLVVPESEAVAVQLRDGGGTVKLGGQALRDALADGARVLDYRGATRVEHERSLERMYGDRPWLAAGQGALSTATMGVSDIIAGEAGYGEQVRETGERSPVARTLGQIGGAGPMLLAGPGGAAAGAARTAGTTARVAGTAAKVARATPAGLLGRAGYAAERGVAKIAGEGLAGRTVAKGVGGLVEGGGMGFASGVTEIAQSYDPVTRA